MPDDYNQDDDALTSGLNPAQRAAATAGLGPILVLAGPGSGKTGVLTRRVAYLLRAMAASARQILAVTFTNKAAQEMRQRIHLYLPDADDSLYGLQIGTFHAVCARLLRTEFESTPYKRDFVIYDTDDQTAAISQAISELNIDSKKLSPRTALSRISAAKNELIDPKDFPRGHYLDELVARVYPVYQKILRASNALDFDDLLMETARLLRENDAVRRKYQERWAYVLVDEFQDTNLAQYELTKLWGAPQNNLFVVGDEDQSIYAFRGADYRNVARFRQDFPSAQIILLEQNYRSTQVVLDAAQHIIQRNKNRTPKRLFTTRQGGDLITLHEAYDDEAEARYIVEQIEALHRKGRRYGEFAVMYRTNPQSRALENAFVRQGIPYVLVGGVGFYKRREVRDVLAYLRLIANEEDRASFARIVNVPKRGVGDRSLSQFNDWLSAESISLAEGLRRLSAGQESPLSGRTAKPLAMLGQQLQGWRELLAQGEPLLSLYDRLMGDLKYLAYLHEISEDENELMERMGNLAELRGLLVKADADGMSLSEFVTEQALLSEGDREAKAEDSVTLLTLHAAKGLEYPVVFISGLEDGLLPHRRALEEPGGIEEERRLFYVGITRAKDKLYLTYAFRRTIGGAQLPSSFLRDLPPEVLEAAGRQSRARDSVLSWRDSTRWDDDAPKSFGLSRLKADLLRERQQPQQPQDHASLPSANPSLRAKITPSPSRPIPTLQFRANQRVRHALYGLGQVVSSVYEGGDEQVTVIFDDKRYGVKTLSASIANLQVL
ncbi:MAG: ATP-dependent helicase [Anaerolineae bacterium]|nr:ATP-dependent helicase [Anaerolineae bacterium]MDW8173490.1 3'-5' exonuclease [Anaerolineae bacterium]